jgi:glycosyltransferase involved in cell wall biosynthesis
MHVTTIPMSLTFLRGQVGFMKARGFAVSAVSSPGPDLVSFGHAEGVETWAVPMPRRITPWNDLMAVVALARLMRRERPTIVHAHTPKGGLLGMISATIARVPVRVYHMRGLPMATATGFRRTLLAVTERVACALAHRVLCVSHSLRDSALAHGLCAPEKIVVLLGGSGNGVDSSGRFNPSRLAPDTRTATRLRLGIPDSATVIGFVGRLVRDKGVIELFDAWQRVRAQDPGVHLLLVGPFEPQDPVPEHIAASLRADPRTHLAGMDWNTPPLYAAMDLVVLPTHREGFPNVPLEAAAMALPVVATRIPGCTDAVADGVTGVLVPVHDATSLADAMMRYVQDRERRRDHGDAGRARVRSEFGQEAIWEALLVEYTRLLQSKSVFESPTR